MTNWLLSETDMKEIMESGFHLGDRSVVRLGVRGKRASSNFVVSSPPHPQKIWNLEEEGYPPVNHVMKTLQLRTELQDIPRQQSHAERTRSVNVMSHLPTFWRMNHREDVAAKEGKLQQPLFRSKKRDFWKGELTSRRSFWDFVLCYPSLLLLNIFCFSLS